MSEPARITGHAEVTTHAADGSAALARQFASKPRIAALLGVVLASVQEVEGDVWDLYALGIDSSSAAALDQLGRVLGQARPAGMADATYRLVLKGVVKVLRSSGTGDELLGAMDAMLDGDGFEMLAAYPASLVFTPDAAPDVPAAVLLEVLRRGASAGVRLEVIDVPDGIDLFTLSADGEEPFDDSDMGFGDSTGAQQGGALVGVVSA